MMPAGLQSNTEENTGVHYTKGAMNNKKQQQQNKTTKKIHLHRNTFYTEGTVLDDSAHTTFTVQQEQPQNKQESITAQS